MRPGALKFLLAWMALGQVALAVRAQTPAALPASATGVISGRVTSSNGELPNNTIVYVSASGATVPPRSALVNSDGTFKVEGLDVGVYRVWAGASGFVSDVSQSSETRAAYHTGESANITLRKGGVITGTVRNSSDAPVIAINVRAFRVRDEFGKAANSTVVYNERLTDDRGVYRIYGLPPGIYVVSAGGISRFFGGFGLAGYDQEVPTFAPSATRDTAMEVTVRSGDEVSADIQYRGEPGHAVSGVVNGTVQSPGQFSQGATVWFTDVKNRTVLLTTFASLGNGYAFAAYGLPDGEYEVLAQQTTPARETRASELKRIKVQGADVTGVNLTLATLPAISGSVVLDKGFTAACVKRRESVFPETMIVARRDKETRQGSDAKKNASVSDQVPLIFAEQSADAVPDAKGDFALRNLHAGTFRLNVILPSTAWYLRSVALGANPKGADWKLVSDGVTLNSQSISGLALTIAEGAARVRGNVTVAESRRSDQIFVYLVPSEKEAASNLLRYFETRSGTDGTFDIRNVPPGEYSLVALKADDDRAPGVLIRQDAALRANVIREAEKSKQKVTLKACERSDNFELTYSPPNKP